LKIVLLTLHELVFLIFLFFLFRNFWFVTPHLTCFEGRLGQGPLQFKMGSISRLILLFLLWVSGSVAEIDTFTLDEVESQISAFIQNTHNGTTVNQRDYPQPSLPTGCTLAVSKSSSQSYSFRRIS
jgi:hypothetical protein